MTPGNVTMQLMNPTGWLYVTRHGRNKWGWEVRFGGWGWDAGMARTKRGALRAARRAHSRYVGGDAA